MAKGILVAAMDFTNVAEDEFNEWYDTEHIPERQRVPGAALPQRLHRVEHALRRERKEALGNIRGIRGRRHGDGCNIPRVSSSLTERR